MYVHSIFRSISGEVGRTIPQGAITYFVRFQACNCTCRWCDTVETQQPDPFLPWVSPREISTQIPDFANVILTGGEPLLQPKVELQTLINMLKKKHCIIQIETNGTIEPSIKDVGYIVDYKTPSSEMENNMMSVMVYQICHDLIDYIKFVVKTQEDLEFTIRKIKEFSDLSVRDGKDIPFLFAISVVVNGIWINHIIEKFEKELSKYILPKIVFNIQLHKQVNLK